jgi:hypothetical protein
VSKLSGPVAIFRDMVNERGNKLRTLDPHDLELLANSPVEHLRIESRPATIAVIVEHKAGGELLVVLQGSMKARLVPFIKHWALDGFHKHLDGSVTPLSCEDANRFG